MTSVLDKPVVDTLDETILDDEPSCVKCSLGAEWIAGCRACNRTVFWCGDHRAKKRIQIMSHVGRGGWHCGDCHARTREWDDLFYERPI